MVRLSEINHVFKVNLGFFYSHSYNRCQNLELLPSVLLSYYIFACAYSFLSPYTRASSSPNI
jgi:uncharacterized BrkB/YihY/UPF0761 family membrane protein